MDSNFAYVLLKFWGQKAKKQNIYFNVTYQFSNYSAVVHDVNLFQNNIYVVELMNAWVNSCKLNMHI